ncbi:hypothetical protein [Bacillus smithii]|uniref:hypothetical protein n=1 Tax=Bacillus smithii TaxID=1479 RepID=UPI002E1C1829|nr:hypothetical protein [Bacillus smithii]
MSVHHYHSLCQKHRGRAVRIRTRDGRIHEGIIHRVHHDRVFIRPFSRGRFNRYGGYGYGWGYGYGGGWGGFGVGIALGAIVGLALLPFFFW